MMSCNSRKENLVTKIDRRREIPLKELTVCEKGQWVAALVRGVALLERKRRVSDLTTGSRTPLRYCVEKGGLPSDDTMSATVFGLIVDCVSLQDWRQKRHQEHRTIQTIDCAVFDKTSSRVVSSD